MQPTAPQIPTCPTCGGALEETHGGGLGCPVCLLLAGIGAEDSGIEAQEDSTTSRRFGVYEIERREDGSLYELGHGGMGETYRAIDTTLQRKVALKVIRIGVATRSAEARERFLREARAAAALRHEHIATVFQFGISEETGQFFYAMELIEGETLDERVRRTGPLSVRATIDIAQQVTSALAAAEKSSLIHRDLKPGNLMLISPDDEEGGTAERGAPIVKIIDFGLAKVLNAPVDAMRLTHDGFVGTPAFASPEQFENSALDVRSDIYSLGATLWFALTGKTPFGGQGFEEIRSAKQSDVLSVEQLKAARVPSRLKSLLKSMLAFEPAARPGTHELTAELRRCAAQVDGERRARIALAAAAILILGASAFSIIWPLSTSSTSHRPPAVTQKPPVNLPVPEKSIAVLPFENRSEEKQNAYFADGVQGEILTDLARVADLKVISRTSVMQYRSGAQRNVREIGQELGVAHVVEGSVQRAENRVRVNVQLVDARTDRQLWAQTYDRDLADVFAIQSEIARAIATELGAKLLPNEESEILRPPTNDITAFDLYTRAKNLFLTPSFSVGSKPSLLEAIDLLNQSVARDPSFIRAYCQLAFTHDALYFFGHDHTPARLAMAEAALQAASRLSPDAGETHLARAWNLYWGYLDYDGALAELEVARRTLPNDPQILFLSGLIQRRQGHWEESTRTLERAAERDPRNSSRYFGVLQSIAGNYATLGRYAEQQRWLGRVLAVEPNDAVTKVILASVDFEQRAETQPLHQTIDSVRATSPAAVPSIVNPWLTLALAERDAAAAKDALIATSENPIQLGDDVYCNRPFMEGVIARVAKDADKARSAFTEARAEQEKIVEAEPNFAPRWCVLGLIDAALGHKEDALREGRRAVELLPVERDAVRGPAMIKYLAMIAAWIGDNDLACQQLAIAARPPRMVTYGQLKLLPFWDPLRGDPCFEKLVASLAPKRTNHESNANRH
ncbi:MAG TPA: protein kinase [Candidatus Udaeobacter sp.]|nr:protein kinase [Candidatus Udaeobacter sp.]